MRTSFIKKIYIPFLNFIEQVISSYSISLLFIFINDKLDNAVLSEDILPSTHRSDSILNEFVISSKSVNAPLMAPTAPPIPAPIGPPIYPPTVAPIPAPVVISPA